MLKKMAFELALASVPEKFFQRPPEMKNVLLMKKRLTFYCFVMALITLDAVLLRSPNLLGKIGLVIYKYSYLRTFPKALLTITIVVLIAVLLSELVRSLVSMGSIKKKTGVILLLLFLLISIGMVIKTGIDFTAWSYAHTGLRFRIGAYLLPCIWVVVFCYHLVALPSPRVEVVPESTDSTNE
jgi:hypothetical protein